MPTPSRRQVPEARAAAVGGETHAAKDVTIYNIVEGVSTGRMLD